MSSDNQARSKLEFYGLLAAGALLTAWYAYPQLLYSLYPLYEVIRLLVPGWLPDLGLASAPGLAHPGSLG